MDVFPKKDEWRYVKLPPTDLDPSPQVRRLKVLAVGLTTVIFGTPKPGKPELFVMVGTYYIRAVTWM